MKVLIPSICIVLLLWACPGAPEIDRQYQILNKSGKTIQLKFYLTGLQPEPVVDVVVKNNNSYTKVHPYRRGNPYVNENNGFYPGIAFGSDSLAIIFDNIKRAIKINYSSKTGESGEGIFSPPLDRNPFRQGNYKKIGNKHLNLQLLSKII